MTQAVDQLEQLGYVERRPDPNDRRARLVFLTPRGQAVRPVAVAAGRGVDGRWSELTSPQEIEALRHALQSLLERLQDRAMPTAKTTMPDLTDFFSRPARAVAPDLIGASFLSNGAGGIIVETEAYEPTEPASHSYNGQTNRNRAMFGGPARVYIYRSYGIHWCLNFVCLPGSAVLIRALEPRWASIIMRERRGGEDVGFSARGPAASPRRWR